MSDDKEGCVGMIIGATLGFIIGIWATVTVVDNTYRTQAIQRGYARWTVDNSGTAKWEWIEPAKKEEPRP